MSSDCHSDWCGFLELMAGNPVKTEQIYNDKPGRYDEPIGNQILGISLDGITYVTRLHEWTIEYRPGSAQDRDRFSSLENLPIGSPIDISPRGDFSNQPPRAKLASEFCQ